MCLHVPKYCSAADDKQNPPCGSAWTGNRAVGEPEVSLRVLRRVRLPSIMARRPDAVLPARAAPGAAPGPGPARCAQARRVQRKTAGHRACPLAAGMQTPALQHEAGFASSKEGTWRSTTPGVPLRAALSLPLKTVETLWGKAPRRTVAEPGAAYGPPRGSGEESISVLPIEDCTNPVGLGRRAAGWPRPGRRTAPRARRASAWWPRPLLGIGFGGYNLGFGVPLPKSWPCLRRL